MLCTFRLLLQVVGTYREKRWWRLFSGVLDTMLRYGTTSFEVMLFVIYFNILWSSAPAVLCRCCYVLGDVKCFVTVALEMISRCILPRYAMPLLPTLKLPSTFSYLPLSVTYLLYVHYVLQLSAANSYK